MAQDRLFQADGFRRLATGRMAEFGQSTIEEDAATRTATYSQYELKQIFRNWDPGEDHEYIKDMYEAYIDGINAYIAEIEDNLLALPAEYAAFGLTPEPFTIEDAVAVMVMMAFRFGGTGGNGASDYARRGGRGGHLQ
jgi:penicillin amidase